MMRQGLDPIQPHWHAYEPSSRGPPPGLPEDVQCWKRSDRDCFTFRATSQDGPDWADVVWRRSIDEETDEVLREESTLAPEFNPHAHFEPWCKKMVTELWFVPPPIDSRGVVKADRADRPSRRQIEEHALENHAVYRSWCPACVEGRATGSKHRARTEAEKEERGPTIHADFFYMSTEEDSAPFLALKSGMSGRLQAIALESKTSNEYVQKAIARFVEETGHKRVVFMSDTEPALVKLKQDAAVKLRNVEVVHRTAPVGDHRANGNAEVAVREIKRQMRSIRISLEQKLKGKISNTSPLLAWMAPFAAHAINCYRRDATGKTPYEKEFGRKWSRPALEFGEVTYMREAVEKDGKPKRDWEQRMIEVRYVGHHSRSGAILGLTPDGLRVGAAVRRLGEDLRWKSEGLDDLGGLPWDVKKRAIGERLESGQRAPRLPPPAPDTPDARAFYVQKKDIDKFGYSEDCRGCKALREGKRAVAHSKQCRERIYQSLSESDGKLRTQRHVERVSSRLEVRLEHEAEEAKKRKVAVQPALEGERLAIEDAPAVPAVQPGAAETLGRRQDGGQEGSPRSPKKWKGDGHMRYKREAETPVQELESGGAAGSTDQAQTVLQPAASDVPPVISAGDVSIEDVLAPEPHGQADAGGDISSIDWGAYEAVEMTPSKCRTLSSLDYCERRLSMRRKELGSVDVAEVFSPPRFTLRAGILGLAPGFAVDLATKKPIVGKEDEYWDLNRSEDRLELDWLIDKEDPVLLTGSPRCDPFSLLQNLSKEYQDNPVRKLRREEGEQHLRQCVELYIGQMLRGRYFLHEHPAGADSWDVQEMVDLQRMDGVYTVSGPMCFWNMRLKTPKLGAGKVYKNTKWVTNSREIAEVLDQYCMNRCGGPIHRHIPLVGGMAHLCEAYPVELVDAVLEGLKRQMRADNHVSALELFASGPDPTEPLFDAETEKLVEEEVQEYFDDISGEVLPSELVRKARQEEIDWIKKIELYDKVPRSMALERNKAILPVRWVDVNKGDKSAYKLRSRIVGKELKVKTKESLLAHELFSATPPWESVKSLFSLLVTDLPKSATAGGQELVMGVYDISRAHFMPKVERELYIELPPEDRVPGEDLVGKLKRNMYGFRDASHGWMKDWQKLLESGGYQVGAANPALFYNEESCSRGAVHGDDFYVLGPVAAVDKMKELLGSKYQMREAHRLGFGEGCVRSATVLSRVVQLGHEGGRRWVQIEPDKRHVELILQTAGVNPNSSNGVTTPSVKPTEEQAHQLQFSPELPPQQASQYRSAVMRASFLAQERCDLAETVKRLAQGMSRPRLAHWEMLKRMARYLVFRPNVALVYRQQRMPDHVRVCVDSDYAGCKVGRKSTTGMVQFLGGHVIKATSNLQTVIGLNVSESEYYALVHGTAHGLGLQAFMSDLGLNFGLVIESDSSSAKAFASRVGLGKQRHVMTRYLWLQQVVQAERAVICKIGTAHNPSDILTKSSSGATIDKHMMAMSVVVLPEAS